MNIFPDILLTAAVAMCHDQFEIIARKLRPATHPDHEKVRRGFMDAVDHYQEQQVENYLREAICYYTGASAPRTGLQNFCDKFGLDTENSCITILDYVQFVAAHKEEISDQLSRAGL